MCTETRTAYEDFGRLLTALRLKVGIRTQMEFAKLVKSTQQTVSRWEKGTSRPRDKEMALIASVLGTDVDELLAAAGYTKRRANVTFDQPFPVDALPPEGFERFALYFLGKLYPTAQVHRAGASGHKQDGVDIDVAHPDGTKSMFQCKREAKFGPANVEKAIRAYTGSATQKVILLSRIASPAARRAAAASDWDIWDIEDISQRIRTVLPKVDQVQLVDTFFRGQRFALLGLAEAGPWQTIDASFAPYLRADGAFNHTWQLVGRDSELATLLGALRDPTVTLTCLVGAGGSGKTRLLLEALRTFEKEQPAVKVWVLSSHEDVTAESLERLGGGEKVLVVDDAHDRDDLATLLWFAADATNKARVLCCLRPYGRDRLRNQGASLNLIGTRFREVPLGATTLTSATQLAEQVLLALQGPKEAAKDIAHVTGDSPLATVVAAHVIAREGLHPELLRNNDEFRRTILSRFEQVTTGQIASGHDADRLRQMLRVLALVQPFTIDDPQLLQLLEHVEGVPTVEANRLLRLLVSAGVLFKRGVHYRLSPDLLADSIIEETCIGPTGYSTGYAERVFDAAGLVQMDHVFVNMGRLDWRRGEGNTGKSRLLDGLWAKLSWRDDFENAHVKAAANVAYYQPAQALAFVRRLMHEKHEKSEDVCRIIRNAAYTYDYLPDACSLLWEVGSGDERPLNQHPNHGIRLLKELANPTPYKPVEVVERVVDFALSLLDYPESWNGPYTPWDVLAGALATEGHVTTDATSRSYTMSAFGVSRSVMKPMRDRIISALIESLSHSNPRRAFTAALTIANALQGPHGLLNRRPTVEERDEWAEDFSETLLQLEEKLGKAAISATVLVRVAESIAWHAFYGPDKTSAIARRIIQGLGRDLRSRTIRLLMDGWGNETWDIDKETYERPEHAAAMNSLLEELPAVFPDPCQLAEYLTACLAEVALFAGNAYGVPHILLNQLIGANIPLAREVVRIRLTDEAAPLAPFGGVALGTLLQHVREEADAQIAALRAEHGCPRLRLVAEAYMYRAHAGQFNETDVSVLRTVFTSKNATVLRYTGLIARDVARHDKLLAIELLSNADMSLALAAVHDYFMWLVHEESIPFALIRKEQLERILSSLHGVPRLDNTWVQAFLVKAMQRDPEAVINLLKARIETAVATKNWSLEPYHRGYGPAARSLRLLEHPIGSTLFVVLLDWALPRIDDGHFSFRFGSLVDGLCGPYDDRVLALLESWLAAGTGGHFKVVAAVLHQANEDLVFAQSDFVRRVLGMARRVGAEAHRTLTSAIFAASLHGVRSGTPGKPFPFDMRLKEHATRMLATIGAHDPTHTLYRDLLAHAEDGIERQLQAGRLMDEEDAHP